MSRPTFRACGDRAVLLEFDGLDSATAWHAALAAHADATLGACTVLVRASPDAVRRLVDSVSPQPLETAASTTIEIPVRYDGPDLDDVAAHTGLSTRDIVAAHTGRPWRVGFAGFAPGFAYLVDGDPRLRVPRRAEPRPRIASGSVGLAGEFSGIYPRASPGGWQLLGTTDAAVWDITQPQPALLRPGMLVQFVEAAP